MLHLRLRGRPRQEHISLVRGISGDASGIHVSLCDFGVCGIQANISEKKKQRFSDYRSVVEAQYPKSPLSWADAFGTYRLSVALG
jgi:hypothetical protein